MSNSIKCVAHECGCDCSCSVCLENPECNPEDKFKCRKCEDFYGLAERYKWCAECIFLSSKKYGTRYNICDLITTDVLLELLNKEFLVKTKRK